MRTVVLLPQRELALLRPRRVAASSMTSSWRRVAVWMYSTTAPRVIIRSLECAKRREARRRSAGRMRLPPASRTWEATSEMTWRSERNSSSTRMRSCSTRPRISWRAIALGRARAGSSVAARSEFKGGSGVVGAGESLEREGPLSWNLIILAKPARWSGEPPWFGGVYR
jgi:hypothetical protein